MMKAPEVRRALSAALVDAMGFAGVGLVSYGAWLVYQPAGFIAGGTLLLAIVVLLSLRGRE